MKITPYIAFNGNCEEAIRFYEKVFNTSAAISRYKDAPAENQHDASAVNENFIMHAQLEIGGELLMFCDMPPEYPVKAGNNITVMLEFSDAETAKTTFAALKEGGTVGEEIGETFWSKLFGSLTDKFGINWYVSLGCPE